jgi:mRNA interferase HigB
MFSEKLGGALIVHVIIQKRIWDAKFKYPDSSSALEAWYRIIHSNNFENYAVLKQTFSSVDTVDDKYVFDIGGNKLRLIANIHFNRQKLYIRDVLTHKEYDKQEWKLNKLN